MSGGIEVSTSRKELIPSNSALYESQVCPGVVRVMITGSLLLPNQVDEAIARSRDEPSLPAVSHPLEIASTIRCPDVDSEHFLFVFGTAGIGLIVASVM